MPTRPGQGFSRGEEITSKTEKGRDRKSKDIIEKFNEFHIVWARVQSERPPRFQGCLQLENLM